MKEFNIYFVINVQLHHIYSIVQLSMKVEQSYMDNQ